MGYNDNVRFFYAFIVVLIPYGKAIPGKVPYYATG